MTYVNLGASLLNFNPFTLHQFAIHLSKIASEA